MRSAGIPIEILIEYVKLCQEGDSTFPARLQLLREQLDVLLEQQRKTNETIERLRYKISRYESAVRTGELTWNNGQEQ